ncbi:MAG: hypothetical protein H6753_03595 [Candidatus Omnitrophica bacterium]|nr:hypothetical protein [Candidatus Omnitrophota bacterium]
MTVYLLEDEKDLAVLLAKEPALQNPHCLFLLDTSPESQALIAKHSIQKIQLPVWDKECREKWLAAYVCAVGQVNLTLHSRLWWATDFSSKNRFNSHLPQLVQKFLMIVEACEISPKDDVIICSVPWQLQGALRTFFLKSDIEFQAKFSLLTKYQDLGLEFLKRIGSGLFHFVRLIGRFIFARMILTSKLQTFLENKPSAYVIKTFVYDHSFSREGRYRDVFFGQLSEFLVKNGQKVIFLANILGDFKSCVKKIAHCPHADIIPIEYCVTLGDIISALWQSVIYRPQVKQAVWLGEHDISDLINAELASCSGKIQIYQYLHYAATRALLKTIAAKCFLLTYENNPWEKMCLLAFREQALQTEILGYQHTVTPQASVNMFISAEEEGVIPKPDRVLTVGAATKDIIDRYTQISSLPVQAACALRYEVLWNLKPLARTKTFNILLALDGIVEVYEMVNYVIQQLIDQKKYKIIIRTHPVLPISLIENKLLYKLARLPFVEISQGYSPIQDIERTDMTIYWGSTVALESLWMGKPIINFDKQDLFSYDPLFDCPHFKWTVGPHQELRPVLEEIYALTDEDFLAGYQNAHTYLAQYFYPVNPANMSPFLPRLQS